MVMGNYEIKSVFGVLLHVVFHVSGVEMDIMSH
jgi:hypothetical protein